MKKKMNRCEQIKSDEKVTMKTKEYEKIVNIQNTSIVD